MQRLRTKKVSTRPSVTDATYAALLEEAQLLLESGQSVIIDASFSRATWRAAAATVATDTSAGLVEVRCTLPADIAAERLHERGATRTDASDADAGIATRCGVTSTSGRLPPTSTLDSHGQSWRHGCESWSSPDATDGLATRWKRARQRQVDVTLG